MLAPFLFNMFFTAILRVAVERYGATADVVKGVGCTKMRDAKGGWGGGGGGREGPEKGRDD